MNPGLRGLAAAAIAVALAQRVVNALRYPVDFGFDAAGNWEYVVALLGSLRLPEPGEGWSTSHPPLFYYLAAGLLRLLGRPEKEVAVPIVRLLLSAAGLGVAALAAGAARAREAGGGPAALLAGLLVLFLPAHIMLSAMFSEEMLAALFASLALVGASRALRALDAGEEAPGWLHAATGTAAGAALLTKFSGVAVLGAIAASYGVTGVRLRHGGAWRGLGLFLGTGLLVSGWYYGWNWVTHGYVYPHGLEAHALMRNMPPGHRELLDYVRFPLSLFTDPQLLDPRLLRSVWGSTFATLWFDGHRHFLPAGGELVGAVGGAMLGLALVPTAAFLLGFGRALLRLLRGAGHGDAPLVLAVLFTAAGYVVFTWQNPWFAVLKGSYLLGLSVPFGVYAGEELVRFVRRGAAARLLAAGSLAALFALTAVTFTQGLVFEKEEPPGLPWYRVGAVGGTPAEQAAVANQDPEAGGGAARRRPMVSKAVAPSSSRKPAQA